MRPGPLPERSARRLTVRLPVIWISFAVSPSPRPLSGSLLVTLMILQLPATLPEHESLAKAATEIEWYAWFGGQSTDSLAVAVTTGGVVSTTVTDVWQDDLSLLLSVPV